MNLDGELYLSNAYYQFRITSDIYINPHTRESQPFNSKGLIKTSKLYFPLNAKDLDIPYPEANRMGVFVERAGLSKTRLLLSFDLGLITSGLFGDCRTSEYCIKNYTSASDYETGEVWEY